MPAHVEDALSPTFAAWVRSLSARFDGAVLRPPPPAIDAASGPASDSAALRAWCVGRSGDGRSPWWRPWGLPRVEQRFAVATWGGGTPAEAAESLEAFARHLDGSDQLAAAGRWAGLWLRLRVKLYDAWAWRARRPSDPWDVGWLVGDASAWQLFRPRRVTLIVADEHLCEAALREAVQVFHARSAGYRHPVRLLIVGHHRGTLVGSSLESHAVAITEIPAAMALR